jgi:hypothetical protein
MDRSVPSRLSGRELINMKICSRWRDNGSSYSSNHINPHVISSVEKAIQTSQRDKPLLVVEAGARAGALGRYLESKYPFLRYLGVEPYPPNGTQAYRIVDCSCEELLSTSAGVQLIQKADILIYADVLEHLVNPWLHLMQIKECAPKETLAIIASVPNFFHHSSLSLISSGSFNYEEWGVLDITHLRFFGFAEIIDLFEMNGFAVDRNLLVYACDPYGQHLIKSFDENGLRSWSNSKLTIQLDTRQDVMKLASYQMILTATNIR